MPHRTVGMYDEQGLPDRNPNLVQHPWGRLVPPLPDHMVLRRVSYCWLYSSRVDTDLQRVRDPGDDTDDVQAVQSAHQESPLAIIERVWIQASRSRLQVRSICERESPPVVRSKTLPDSWFRRRSSIPDRQPLKRPIASPRHWTRQYRSRLPSPSQPVPPDSNSDKAKLVGSLLSGRTHRRGSEMVSSSSELFTLSNLQTLLKQYSRFHPMVRSSGSVVIEGAIVDAKGDGMFVHAIQGMRPDSVSA